MIDYNPGNPDGVLDPGEEPRPPRCRWSPIYPKEGTLFSDNPFFILDAAVGDRRAEARAPQLFDEFVQQPENQARVLEFGFRPGNPAGAVGDADRRRQRRRPRRSPRPLLEVPEPDGDGRACSTRGPSSARRPGCCW